MTNIEKAIWTLKHGSEFPYDAPDSWWKNGGDYAPLPAIDWAHTAARGILADLQDRRGIRQELDTDNVSEGVRVELVQALAEIIRQSYKDK